jgi:hypothetical protein
MQGLESGATSGTHSGSTEFESESGISVLIHLSSSNQFSGYSLTTTSIISLLYVIQCYTMLQNRQLVLTFRHHSGQYIYVFCCNCQKCIFYFQTLLYVRYEVLTAETENYNFWDITPCNLASQPMFQRNISPYHQGLRVNHARSQCHSVCFMLVSYLAYHSTLKMEAICSSKTLAVFQQITRHHIPKNRTLHIIIFYVAGSSI